MVVFYLLKYLPEMIVTNASISGWKGKAFRLQQTRLFLI